MVQRSTARMAGAGDVAFEGGGCCGGGCCGAEEEESATEELDCGEPLDAGGD